MAEYIEREAAIKAIDHEVSLDGLYANIKAVPAADVRPERHGKRIRDDYQERDYDGGYSRIISYKCSCCNKNTDWKMTDFCGNCGAKMEGVI